MHPAIDAVHALKQQTPIDADAIDRIEVGVTKYTFDKLCYLVPNTGLEAKFSMPYTVARSILDETIGFDTFTDELVRNERARDLTRRVSMYVHEGIETAWKVGSRPVHVRIRFRDGRVLEQQVDISKGNPEVPMAAKELSTKFEDCARLCLEPSATKAAIHALQTIEMLPTISELTARLSARKRAAA